MLATANIFGVQKVFGGDTSKFDSTDAIITADVSHDNCWIGAASTSGAVHFFGVSEGSFAFSPRGLADTSTATVTSFHFHPLQFVSRNGGDDKQSQQAERRYRGVSSMTNGAVTQWEFTPHGNSKIISSVKESRNETLVATYSPLDGSKIATGGSDKMVRLYDAESMQLLQTFEQGIDNHGQPTLGHPSRIFAIKFASPDVFVSAGWECAVLLWDARAGGKKMAQRCFQGPRVSGDAIDVSFQHSSSSGVLVAASDRTTHQIEAFDFASGKQMFEPITVDSKLFGASIVPRQPNSSSTKVWVAGNNAHAAMCFDLTTRKCIAAVKKVPEALFSVAACRAEEGGTVLIGGAHNAGYRLHVDYNSSSGNGSDEELHDVDVAAAPQQNQEDQQQQQQERE